MVVVDAHGVIQLVNEQAEALFGYERSELLGQSIEILAPDDVRARHIALRAGYDGAHRPMMAARPLLARRKDGSHLPVEISLSRLQTDDGAFDSVAVRDISVRLAAEQNLRESEERFRLTLEMSPLGMAQVAADGRWLRVNQALCRLLGRTESELLRRTLQDITHPDDVVAAGEKFRSLVEGEKHGCQLDMRYVHALGHEVWVSVHVSIMRAGAAEGAYFIVQVEDITSRRTVQDELRALATTDPLTGLANRSVLVSRAQCAVGRDASHGPVAFLLIDLDHFKKINDTRGHRAGDALLLEVAQRLQQTAREAEVVARFGGDEFAILVCGLPCDDSVAAFAERLLAVVRDQDILVPDVDGSYSVVAVDASIGIATAPAGAQDTAAVAEDLYRRADLALYEAKGRGRARLAVYDDAMAARLSERVSEEAQLRLALTEDRIVTVRQPIIDLSSGTIIGHEALARVLDITGDMVAPARFLPAAQSCGLLPAVDVCVLREVLAELEGDPAGSRTDTIAINVSAETLANTAWTGLVHETLERRPDLAARLHVELTEQVLMEHTGEAATALQRLRACGVRVGLDDFGTGYSALSYLQDLSIDFIKLDRSLVEGVGRSDRANTLARSLILLAHALGLTVVAEGIERPEQITRLRALGCDAAQGYLIGMPALPAALPKPRVGEHRSGWRAAI